MFHQSSNISTVMWCLIALKFPCTGISLLPKLGCLTHTQEASPMTKWYDSSGMRVALIAICIWKKPNFAVSKYIRINSANIWIFMDQRGWTISWDGNWCWVFEHFGVQECLQLLDDVFPDQWPQWHRIGCIKYHVSARLRHWQCLGRQSYNWNYTQTYEILKREWHWRNLDKT